MNWYKVKVNKNEDYIQKEFEKLFLKLNAPLDMGLFVDKDFFGNERTYYFTPVCKEHISGYLDNIQCIPCEKPKDNSCALLVIHGNSFNELIHKKTKFKV